MNTLGPLLLLAALATAPACAQYLPIAQAVARTEGGDVYLRPGVHRVSGTLEVTGGQRVIGYGTTLVTGATATAPPSACATAAGAP